MISKKVYMVLIDDNGDVLLAKGGYSGGMNNERQGLHLPGGTVKQGESNEDVAYRECKEEIYAGIDDIKCKESPCETKTFSFTKKYGKKDYEVGYIIQRVDSVQKLKSLVEERMKSKEIEPGDDTPFKGVEILNIHEFDCNKPEFKENFNEESGTDWFGEILEKVKKDTQKD